MNEPKEKNDETTHTELRETNKKYWATSEGQKEIQNRLAKLDHILDATIRVTRKTLEKDCTEHEKLQSIQPGK